MKDVAEELRAAGLISSWIPRGVEVHLHISNDALLAAQPRFREDFGGSRLLVQFCDPNTTKALHLGHLRNIAIGNALASMYEATGRIVIRQSVVCDFGRGVSEAIAGWMTAERGDMRYVKSDHAVGEQYARYVNELSTPVEDGIGPADKPVAREAAATDDLAQQLFRGWLRESPGVRERWTSLRDLVLQGHEETMSRLGVRVDRKVYESEWCHLNGEIVQRGLESGLFESTPEGDVIYRTGLEEQEQITLLRKGIYPTVHLRTLAVWVGIDPCLAGLDAILVGGDEWRTHDVCIETLLTQYLGSDRRCATPTHVTYGMVHQDGSLMKSSTGVVTLIDDILREVGERTGALFSTLPQGQSRALAAKALLGYFLGFPLRETLDVDIDRFSNPRENLALQILCGWAQARQERGLGAASTAELLRSRESRWLLIQEHWTEACSREGRLRLDPRLVVRCYAYLAKWYLADKRSPEASAVASAVLERGLTVLGLLPEGSHDRGPTRPAGRASDHVGIGVDR